MQVRILPFGILKDWLVATALDVPEGATVGFLLEYLASGPSKVPGSTWASIAVSVNHEYAQPGRILCEGDEVGLLPPVSGGSEETGRSFLHELIGAPDLRTAVALCRRPIESDGIIEAIKHGEDGAVVVFDGIVRNNSRGRQTQYLDYEAYEPMADKQMRDLAEQAISGFGIRQAVIVHRLGRLTVGESSVLIVVASAHRAQAYEASRWLIDTLKKTVPIWKKETFVDGAVWAEGEPFPESIGIHQTETAHGS
ncbi:MAG TPA: molybdenum cofactor biosynthesis protein MoaE [Terracidiphilus sp.]|jgi:molybdopterin synthase catalytic subunit